MAMPMRCLDRGKLWDFNRALFCPVRIDAPDLRLLELLVWVRGSDFIIPMPPKPTNFRRSMGLQAPDWLLDFTISCLTRFEAG